MIVETERLVLRPWVPDDIEDLTAVFAEPSVWRFPFGRGLTGKECEAFLARQIDHWDDHGFGLWAVEHKPGSAVVGYIGLAIPHWLPEVLPAVEVGWRLHPHHRGQGLATEGAKASLRHGFEQLGLDRIIAICQPENAASVRVVEKLGMRHWRDCIDPEREINLAVREMSRAGWSTMQSLDDDRHL